MEYIMREARPEDAQAVDNVMLVISEKCTNLDRMAKQIEKLRQDPQKYLLVAVDPEDNTICGSLLGVVFEDICETGRPILLVENVAVLEEYQGRGVGRQMFEEIERWGKEMDCHYEMLVSGLNRIGAHKFYNRLGFEEVKGFKKYFE